MQLDRPRLRDSVQRAHLSQIRTKLTAIAHRDFQVPRRWQFNLSKPRKMPPQCCFQLFVPHLKRIEFNQQRTIRWMQIADARHWLQFEQPQQPTNIFIRLKCDPTL